MIFLEKERNDWEKFYSEIIFFVFKIQLITSNESLGKVNRTNKHYIESENYTISIVSRILTDSEILKAKFESKILDSCSPELIFASELWNGR